MTDKKTDITSSQDNPELDQGSESNVSEGRRKLIKGAIGTAPIVMTLASRPANAIMCGSGVLQSANLSNKDHDDCVCGFSPGAWGTPDQGNGDGDRSQWIAAGFQPGTCRLDLNPSGNCTGGYNNDGSSFDAVFGSSDDVPSGLSMLNVILLHGPGTDPDNYAAHMVAALLNAEYFKSLLQNYALQKSLILEIHNQVLTYDYYTTAAGVKMYPSDIVLWIQATFCSIVEIPTPTISTD